MVNAVLISIDISKILFEKWDKMMEINALGLNVERHIHTDNILVFNIDFRVVIPHIMIIREQ